MRRTGRALGFWRVTSLAVSPMLKIDGLWVHQGVPVPHDHWGNIVEDAREERHRQLSDAMPFPYAEPTP